MSAQKPTMSQHADKAQPIPRSSALLTSRYLLLYNITMTAGWTVVFLRLLRAIVFTQNIYNAVALPLKIFQTGAILEIIHSFTGLIRASAATTTLQVSSRLMLVWGVTDAIEQVRDNISVCTMVAAWSLTEIPRYFYFSVAAVANTVPFWLTITRYSTFIPLYPMGASSEWFTLFAALPHIRQSKLFSLELPNTFNFAFDYYTYCIIILALYIPGLPFMYSHMLKQRRKYVIEPARKLAKAK